jgi:cell division protein FtsB
VRPLILIALVALVALGYALANGRSGVRAWWQLGADLAAAETRNAQLEAEIEALRAEAEALRTGSFAIERAIREDLELAHPDEIVVRIPSDASRP